MKLTKTEIDVVIKAAKAIDSGDFQGVCGALLYVFFAVAIIATLVSPIFGTLVAAIVTADRLRNKGWSGTESIVPIILAALLQMAFSYGIMYLFGGHV
jgi:hypothetical protein